MKRVLLEDGGPFWDVPDGRIDLAASIPLPAPFTLLVEPTNVCNFKCPICPESFSDYATQAGYYERMSRETWCHVADSMLGWCRLKVLRFYDVGEPLLNRDLHLMIAASREFADRTEVTTNGSLLTPDLARRLVASGLDYIRISVYGTSEEEYRRQTGVGHGPLRILQNVADLRAARKNGKPHIHAELVTTESGHEQEFVDQWGFLADSTSVKAMHTWGSSLVTLGEKPKKLVCPYPFYELVVKANGDVTVCCVDWRNQLAVGNVNLESLRSIWEGPRLRELQNVHLAGERSRLVACRGCNVPDTCPDDLDGMVGKRLDLPVHRSVTLGKEHGGLDR